METQRLIKGLVLLAILSVAFCDISIIEPDQLKVSILELHNQTNSIPFSIANFGHIPYGKQVMGNIMLANPSNACIPIQPLPENQGAGIIILIKRGECTFTTKVKHA